jgi:hypothetical protein
MESYLGVKAIAKRNRCMSWEKCDGKAMESFEVQRKVREFLCELTALAQNSAKGKGCSFLA